MYKPNSTHVLQAGSNYVIYEYAAVSDQPATLKRELRARLCLFRLRMDSMEEQDNMHEFYISLARAHQ